MNIDNVLYSIIDSLHDNLIRHGTWRRIYGADDVELGFKCSNCHTLVRNFSKFCPACGCNMDSIEEGRFLK